MENYEVIDNEVMETMTEDIVEADVSSGGAGKAILSGALLTLAGVGIYKGVKYLIKKAKSTKEVDEAVTVETTYPQPVVSTTGEVVESK